ncbi:MAG: hypothetical protein AB8I80_04960 [Anaerolineae bacterium]|jgi:hypothetical protein
MKRAVAFSLATAVVVLLLGALLLIEVHHPDAWQDELMGHLARLNAEGDTVRLLAVRRALAPHMFDGQLSHTVWGDNTYTAGHLPYPPDRLFCVQLEHQHVGTASRRQVVFVALHTDLYGADWVVHEGAYAPFDPPFVAALRTVGCASVLDVGR